MQREKNAGQQQQGSSSRAAPLAPGSKYSLGHEANPKSGKGHSKNGGLNGNAPKVGKFFEKTYRKTHFRGREGKKGYRGLTRGPNAREHRRQGTFRQEKSSDSKKNVARKFLLARNAQ